MVLISNGSTDSNGFDGSNLFLMVLATGPIGCNGCNDSTGFIYWFY